MSNYGYILLLGRTSDSVLQYLAKFLHKNSRRIIFIDQDLLGSDIKIDYERWFLSHNVTVSHSDIKSVFNRSASLFPGEKYPKTQILSNKVLAGLLDYGYEYVVNRPSAIMSNCSKPYQSNLVKNFSLNFPDYAVLANVKLQDLTDDIIFKSISSVRSIVKKITDIENNEVFEPILFQRYIPGDNIRVHVICEEVVAIRIKSRQADYRYCKDTVFSYFELPPNIYSTCLEIAKFLKLNFCGIDLILSKGEYFFLEVNPSPGYSYYESRLYDMPISKAILSMLDGAI
jgi:hypothetical protein